MTINYSFLNGVYELLNAEGAESWKDIPLAKLNKIESDLSVSPEEKLQSKIQAVEEKSGKSFGGNKEKLLETYKKDQEKLQKLKAHIEESLSKGVYPLGVEPFGNEENSQSLLGASYILKLNSDFNTGTVNALEEMLRNNFDELITEDVKVKFFDRGVRDESDSVELIIRKLQNKEEVNIEDFQVPKEALDYQETVNNLTKLAGNMKFVHSETLEFAYKKLQFITSFYKNDGFPCGVVAELLSQALGSRESIECFFKNHFNFQSLQHIEDSVLTGTTVPSLSNLNEEELLAWRKIVKDHGKNGLERFMQLDNLQKMEDFDITEIVKLDNPMAVINQKAENISFARHEENSDIANLCLKYRMPESTFNKILDTILPKQKNSDNLPDISFEIQNGKYSFKKLEPGHIDGLFLGKMTNCCQFIDGDSEKCVIDGFTREDAGFYIIRDKKGKIKAQSYAWIGLDKEGNDVIIFDSFEYLDEAKDTFLEVVKEFKIQLLNQTEYKGLYVGMGGKTPSVNAQAGDDTKPKFDGLYQYADSKNTFKVTDDLSINLNTFNPNDNIKSSEFEGYDQFIMLDGEIAYKNLKEQYKDQISNIDNKNYTKKVIQSHSVLINKILSDNIFSLEQILKFASDACKVESGYKCYYFINTSPDMVSKYLNAINEISTNQEYKPLYELLKNKDNPLDSLQNFVGGVYNADTSPWTKYCKMKEQSSSLSKLYLEMYIDSEENGNKDSLTYFGMIGTRICDEFSKEEVLQLINCGTAENQDSGYKKYYMPYILQSCDYNVDFSVRKSLIKLVIESFSENLTDAMQVVNNNAYQMKDVYKGCPDQASAIIKKVIENYSSSPESMTSILIKISTALNEETAQNLGVAALNDSIVDKLGVENLLSILEKSDFFLPSVATNNPELVSSYLNDHGINDNSIDFLGHCYAFENQLYDLN